VDGTFAGSYASRHTPIKAQVLARRCQQLDAVLAADFSRPAQSLSEPAPAADPQPATVDRSPATGSPPEPAPAADPTPAPAAAQVPEAAPPSLAAPVAPPSPAAQPAWMAGTPGGRFRQRQRYRRAEDLL